MFLNLASRPFRNERSPRVLYAALWFAVVLVTIVHGTFAARLRPSRTEERRAELARLEGKLERMRAREAAPATAVDAATLVRWRGLKELVDQRAFSWTLLLSDLEPLVPPGVRITSLSPKPHPSGLVSLELEALARSPEQVLEFVTALEREPQFEDVYPLSVEDTGGQRRASYAMSYAARPVSPPDSVRAEPPS